MSGAVVDLELPVAETEAYHELMTRAGRRTGKIPADLMVRHVLSCVPPHEWPTRVEAMDAVLRTRPPARTVCGWRQDRRAVGCWACM